MKSIFVLLFCLLFSNLYAQVPAMTQEQYDNSLALFEAGKKEHNNSYEFAFAFASFSGHWSKTFIVVEEGKIVERRYVTGNYSAKKPTETLEWIEKGDSLGTHSEGKRMITMDELYLIGKSSIGQKTREEVKMPLIGDEDESVAFTIIHYYGFEQHGLLSTVGHQHADCMDDCFEGFNMTDFKWGKPNSKKKKKKNCSKK